MRFSWRRKKHVSMKVHDLESAQAFLNTQFNSEGIYQGDNPYLSEVTISDMLYRWRASEVITADEFALLRRANLDDVATVIIKRKDGGAMFADDDDQKRFVDIAAFIPQDADMAMTMMKRVAVAETMELRPDKAIVHLRLYEGTAYHCAEYLCKFYDYHLRLKYNKESEDFCMYKVL